MHLVSSSTLAVCPHLGSIDLSARSDRARSTDSVFLRASDIFTVVGCTFALGNTPHPCVTVQWVQTAMRCKVLGDFLLNEDSVGLCLAADNAPQGTVIIQSTQTRVSGQ